MLLPRLVYGKPSCLAIPLRTLRTPPCRRVNVYIGLPASVVSNSLLVSTNCPVAVAYLRDHASQRSTRFSQQYRMCATADSYHKPSTSVWRNTHFICRNELFLSKSRYLGTQGPGLHRVCSRVRRSPHNTTSKLQQNCSTEGNRKQAVTESYDAAVVVESLEQDKLPETLLQTRGRAMVIRDELHRDIAGCEKRFAAHRTH